MELRVLNYFLACSAGGELHKSGQAAACDPAHPVPADRAVGGRARGEAVPAEQPQHPPHRGRYDAQAAGPGDPDSGRPDKTGLPA